MFRKLAGGVGRNAKDEREELERVGYVLRIFALKKLSSLPSSFSISKREQNVLFPRLLLRVESTVRCIILEIGENVASHGVVTKSCLVTRFGLESTVIKLASINWPILVASYMI